MPNGPPDEILAEQLQTPDPGLKLLGRYRMTGPPPLVSLLRRIRPVAILDDLRSGVPGQFQPDPTVAEFERPCAGFAFLTPTAGNAARLELINLSSTGVHVIVEDLIARTNAAGATNIFSVNLVAAPASFSLLGTREFRDSRLAGTPNAGFRGVSVSPALSLDWQLSIGSPLNRPIQMPYVLGPGFALRLESGTADVPLQIGLRWRERSIVSS